MATVTGYTKDKVDELLAAKAPVSTTVVKGALTLNAKDYGAVGDGVTNDTAAIASAIAAIPAGGGSVYLPAGSYLLGGTAGLTLSTAGSILRGAGPQVTKILVGGSVTAAAAVDVTAANCQVSELSINGASATTTSNPYVNGVRVNGVRRARVTGCAFFNVNGWAIEAVSASSGSTANPLGTQISRVLMNDCAGGVYFLGNTAQSYAMNAMLSDIQAYSMGAASGTNANLDSIRIEDAWDVLVSNAMLWQGAGTGNALHIKGNSTSSIITNLDAVGTSTGSVVKIEDGTNGSPLHVQLLGGIVQSGLIGIQVSGASNRVNINTVRAINNQTHGLKVDGTGPSIYVNEMFFSGNGAGASGSNYEINWSGSATGYITNSRFQTAITSIGIAGVQQSINIASVGQLVRVIGASFFGTSAAAANWFTNLPASVLEMSNGDMNFATQVRFTVAPGLRPATSGANALGINVNGADTFDRLRILGTGAIELGPGSAARDTTWSRQGVAMIGTSDSDIVIGLAGKGVRIKEGTNARMGVATLVAGTVTVNNTSVTANTRIMLSIQNSSGTIGAVYVSARVAGTSFTITSTNAAHTSIVAWELIEPAP